MKILYKLTTRERPEQALRAIKSVVELSKSKDYKFLISLDFDDAHNYYLLDDYFANTKIDVVAKFNETSLGKIGSINSHMEHSGNWDILVNLSDDQVFVMDGFDEIIRAQFILGNTNSFPFDKLDKFIHFPDGNQPNLATMSIMGRTYYERDKYIYHPSYKNVYCDNEAQDVAIQRGCYKFVDATILHHLHPAWGKADNDRMYIENENPLGYEKDRINYETRKANNFKD